MLLYFTSAACKLKMENVKWKIAVHFRGAKMKYNRSVTALDAIERMKFFSSPPRRAVVFHVFSFYFETFNICSVYPQTTGAGSLLPAEGGSGQSPDYCSEKKSSSSLMIFFSMW